MKKQLKNFKSITFFIFIMFGISNCLADENLVKPLVFHGGYTFSSFKGQKSAAIYLTLINAGNNDIRIKSIKTDLAKKAEIHEIISEKDIIRMSKIDNFLIKKSQTIFFQPGSTHIMVFGLKEKLVDKKIFEIEILTDDSNTYVVEILVIDKRLRQ